MKPEEETQLSDRAKRSILMLGDAIVLSMSLWASVVLRYGTLDKDMSEFWWLFPTASILGVATFYKLGLYRAIVRYIGPGSMLLVIHGATIAAVGVSLVAYLSQAYTFPRSAPAIFWFISILLVGGSRIAIRTYFYGLFNNYLTREPVAIYGAGETGAQLAMALLNDSNYMPVAFFDDNRALRKYTIHGIRVHDSENLDRVVNRLRISQILLAVPSATAQQRKAILDRLSELPVHIRTVPSFGALLSGRSVTEISEIEIGDLLGREVVPPKPELLERAIKGKSVLVTGAGGTIGSELCRKILAIGPKRLVLFDNSEFALYSIEGELQSLVPAGTELIALLGSVLNESHLSLVMADFGVQTVYHAAAYKHVHMVERNMIEGVRNNVVGTWNVVQAAEQNRVEDFVLISTDKAVRPTNVMGATKRLAELIVQAFAKRNGHTRLCMVRFGNVLRSSGSVVPIFEQQVRRGGPVEVTHRDATRYFMTASEAAELVIQAGALSSGGEVFVLDMGEPVRIYELAERMIHLHGFEFVESGETKLPGQIAIKIIGLRPGEKLTEELIIGDSPAGTSHPKILKVNEEDVPFEVIRQACDTLRQACEGADYLEVKRTLEATVTGYRVVDAQADPLLVIESKKRRANVTAFPKKED